MKIIVLLLALLSPGAFAQSHEQLAREYHAIVFPTQREAILQEFTKAALARQPGLAPYAGVYREWLASVLDSREYETSMVATYMELLGVSELENLVANARLPAYHQYMVDQPLLDRVKADRTDALVRSRQAELQERLKRAGYRP